MKHTPLFQLGLIALLSLTANAEVATKAAPVKDIPSEEVNALYKMIKAQPRQKAERLAHNKAILAQTLASLEKHKEVPVTAEFRDLILRKIALPSAEAIYMLEPTDAHRAQLVRIADLVIATPVWDSSFYGDRRKPVTPEKVHAGYILARLAIFPTPDAKPVDAEKHINAMLARYAVRPDVLGTEAAHAQAIVKAARLATETGEKKLADALCAQISEKYMATPGAFDALKAAGHEVILRGSMTTLDGKTINLPADTQGKIVLLDFWATWCGPCKASLPHVKQLHEKYKDRGVMIIGVSCDSPFPKETPADNKAKVEKFLADNGYGWTQVYSGEWPTIAKEYGVGSIPTVFLINAEGKIVSTTARGNEEALIEAELAKAKSAK